ncbi:MAG: PKD domain-containing protein [Bacteroidia bacterium]
MKKHLFVTILLAAILFFNGKAQIKPQRSCGTIIPPKQWEGHFQQLITQYLIDVKEGRIARGAVREIPVIVHVINGGEAKGTFPNLDSTQINSQIQILNDDFEGNGLNTQNIPGVFKNYKADLNIKFMMATVDTTGTNLIEPGIHRVNYNTLPGHKDPNTVGYGATNSDKASSFMKFINDTIKKNTIWDPKKYFNIWITECKKDVGLLGFATFPESAGLENFDPSSIGNSLTDGVWCGSGYFGLSQINAPYNMGRTSSHEIGHWLGLRHIWGDDKCGNDYCLDTPPAEKANYSGMIHPYKLGVCPNNTTGEMFMNFMDYSEDLLMNMFTKDQHTRVQTTLNNGIYRKSLGTHGLVAAITVPIADYDVSDTVIYKNKPIRFINTSLGTPDSYLWNFGIDAYPATSKDPNPPPISYFSGGDKTITLTVKNKFGSNTTSRVKSVKQICSNNILCADFSSLLGGIPKNTIDKGQSLSFKDLSTGNPTYWSWVFEGGTPNTSSSKDPVVTYNAPGIYKVILIVASATTKDTMVKNGYVMVLATYNKGTSYTCIAIDTNKNIWAGTSKAGVFLLDKKTNPSVNQFNQLPFSGTFDPTKFNIQSIACDGFGNTWVGHSGSGNISATTGGMERIDYNNIATIQHYGGSSETRCLKLGVYEGLASRNTQCIAVDRNNTVWTAHKYHDLIVSPDYLVTPGGLSYKLPADLIFTSKSSWKDYQDKVEPSEFPYPAYTCNPKPNETAQTRTCNSVACGNNEVWLSVYPYQSIAGASFSSRILRYDLTGKFIAPEINFATIGIPAGGVFNGIYITNKGNAWVSISAGKGFAVRIDGVWKYITSADIPCVFPTGASINQNAIWGNKFGNVYFGTTKGILVYNGTGNVSSASSYSFYSFLKENGTDKNITGGLSEQDSIQWISSDDGIIRTVIGKYNMTIDDIDYTSCNNSEINTVEAAIKAGEANLSYHQYEVITEICDKKNSNYPNNCTAEHVYSMLKKYADLTIPTPPDYPTNVLDIYQQQNQGILFSLLTKSPFEMAFDALTTASLSATQNSENPSSVISCTQQYKLYGNAKGIVAKYLYDKGPSLKYFKDCSWQPLLIPPFDFSNSMDDYCGNQLKSVEYDPVFIFANDKKKTITNYTDKGHILYPGKIERTVVEECGTVKIITKGVGTQYCGDNCRGQLMGKANKVLGNHLFKAVDQRVKIAFESGK